MSLRIHAVLQTLSPLHIAAPGDMRFDEKTGEIAYGDTGIACTAIQRLPVLSEGKTLRLPVIAANNIAGRLRRHAAKQVLEALNKKGEKVSLATYSVLMCGASTGKPDKRDLTYAEYKQSHNHPYFGLFGGGPRMLRRNVWVHNALPITETTVGLSSALSHPKARQYVQGDSWLTRAWAFRRNDDISMLADLALQEQSIEDFVEKFQSRQADILADKAKSKNGEASSRLSTQTFSAFEFVIPGVHFGLTFELNTDEAQAGLFLVALDEFCARERLGGHSRNGFGLFRMHDVVLIDESNGEEHSIFNNGRLLREDMTVMKLLDAWQEAAGCLSAEELDAMCSPPEGESQEKKVKGKKTVAA